MSEKKNIVGIDLGTTFSAIAILDELGVPHVVPNGDGDRLTRSVIYAPPGETTILVGDDAHGYLRVEPDFVVEEVKRKMGTGEMITVGDRTFRPAEISAFILKKLIQDAEKIHGKISEAVITVPANFMEAARSETMEAGALAGITVKHIINEPTAAALHFAMHKKVSGNIVIFDLGGGTFDVTCAEVKGMEVKVKTSEGAATLGGRDFDDALLKLLEHQFEEESGEAMFAPDKRAEALMDAEKLKKLLSKLEKAHFTTLAAPGNVVKDVTREQYESQISAFVAQCEMTVEAALAGAGWEISDVTEVLLVGGSSRTPAVKGMLKGYFGRELNEGVNPDEAVALGAAVYAGLMADSDGLTPGQKKTLSSVSVKDVTPHFFGTSVYEARTDSVVNTTIVPKDLPLPCSKKKQFGTRTRGQTLSCDVNQSKYEEPDMECVERIYEHLMELPSHAEANSLVEVTFTVNTNGTMDVLFEHPDTNTKQEATIPLGGSTAKKNAGASDDPFDIFQID